jgi:hypothetical protein
VTSASFRLSPCGWMLRRGYNFVDGSNRLEGSARSDDPSI